jgi:hypothetical protein
LIFESTKYNQEFPNMTGFVDLPLELRMMVYNEVLKMIWVADDRIFWVPEVSEVDINKIPTIAISRRQGEDFRPTGGPYIFRPPAFFYRLGKEYPTVNLNYITPLVSLARTSKLLHNEVLSIAWSHSDLRVQGTLKMVCGLLGPRLALYMTPLIQNSITDLKLVIYNPSERGGYRAMKDIVGLINAHLPTLKRLDISIPHITSSRLHLMHLWRPSAKAVFAQLLHLRLDLRVVFHVYLQCMRGGRCGCRLYHPHDELTDLLTGIHDMDRAVASMRQSKKQDCDLFDLDYYLLETRHLRSISHHEEGSCSPDRMV